MEHILGSWRRHFLYSTAGKRRSNMNEILNQNSTWKKSLVPRGKCHNKTETKTTVSLYLNKRLVEKARNHALNLSRITEQALSSILEYMETQNIKPSSESLSERSLQRESSWAGSLARLGHLLDVQKVAGSSPVRPTKHQPETFLLKY